MNDNTLAQDNFQERAVKVRAAISMNLASSLTLYKQKISAFNAVRRREIRLAQLKEAGREININSLESHEAQIPAAYQTFRESIAILRKMLREIQSMLIPELDDLLSKAKNAGSLREGLRRTLLDYGLSSGEVDWMLRECDKVDFRLIDLVVNGNPENLHRILESASSDENGLLHCGFLRFTGKEDVDQQISGVITRCRSKGVTASVLLVLTIVVAAILVVNVDANVTETASKGSFLSYFQIEKTETAKAMSVANIKDIQPLRAEERECIEEIRTILENHNCLNRFGLCLLHEHFPLEDDEILKESCDEKNRTLTIKPVKKSLIKDMKTIETSWNLTTGLPLIKCDEYHKCD